MSVIPITCDNCGAKYKLPPTFKGAQAKCQKCGSVIDVAKQRATAGDDAASPAAAAKPATARPAAAAKPAVDRSKARPAAAGGRKSAAEPASPKAERPASGGSSRSRRGKKDDDGEETPRRGREKKKDNMPMILGGVGLVAIVIVVAVVMMNKDDKKADETANKPTNTADATANDATANDATASKAGETKQPQAPKTPAATDTPDEGSQPAVGGTPDDGKKPEATTPEATTPAAATPVEPPPAPIDDDPNVKKERWQKQKNPPQSMSEVKTAIELFGEVKWPSSIDAAKKAEIMSLVENLDKDGGLPSIRAKASLVKEGYAGLFGILEALSKLDYRQTSDGAFGFELNKAIEEITGGLNAGYAAVQADEQMHPAKAYWNTQTVNAWMRTFAKWPDEAALTANKRSRASKDK